nr:hypothetical protein CFP56_22706 [Quercus suber]
MGWRVHMDARVKYRLVVATTLRQESQSRLKYLQLAKSWADQLAATIKPMDDDDLISYIVNGLNPSFNAFITTFSLATREASWTYVDFEAELLNHETLPKIKAS